MPAYHPVSEALRRAEVDRSGARSAGFAAATAAPVTVAARVRTGASAGPRRPGAPRRGRPPSSAPAGG